MAEAELSHTGASIERSNRGDGGGDIEADRGAGEGVHMPARRGGLEPERAFEHGNY